MLGRRHRLPAIKGRGLLNLQVELLDEAHMQEVSSAPAATTPALWRPAGGRRAGAVPALAQGRTQLPAGAGRLRDARGGDGRRLPPATVIGGTPLASRPNLPVALWVLACACLLRATQQFAGHEKNSPGASQLVERGAWGLAALAILALFVPSAFLPQLQAGGLALLLATAAVCCLSLFMDPRHWRWTTLLAWTGVLVALLALPMAWAQLMPETQLARRGYQMLLALLLACYLVLPWLRQALRERAMQKRAVVVEPSAEEKIADAREWLMSSLQAGMESAREGDMEWIAYRRLMAGLKPVLPQSASAVIAMNYHNEDLLLVEPASAEERFRMLLNQRASLLKNLSRSLGPQQIVLDFDGPEGPLAHVMLAIIPCRWIARAGARW
jgi:hypothetical protein